MAHHFKLFVLFLVIFVIINVFLDCTEAKGGRGGRFGGSRYGRSRYSGRTRTRNRVAGRVRSNLRSRFFNWKTAAAAGAIYGWVRYSRTPRYRRSPNNRPEICVNLYDYKMTNGSTYQMFFCPLNEQPADYTYCCGPEDRQRCCRFWDNGGRVFGVVVAILFMIGIIGLVVYCCCCKKKKTQGFMSGQSKQDNGATYTMTSVNQPVADIAPSYPQNNGSQDTANTPYQYPPSVAEPEGYNASYPLIPGNPPAPYPSGGAAPAPYPPGPYPQDQNNRVNPPYPPEKNGVNPPYPSPSPQPQGGMMPYPAMPGNPGDPGYNTGQGNAPYPLNPAGSGGYPAAPPPPYPAN